MSLTKASGKAMQLNLVGEFIVLLIAFTIVKLIFRRR